MEPLKGDLLAPPPDDIGKQIQELSLSSGETFNNIASKVIKFPQISIFGEENHTLRPRGSEMIELARTTLIPPTYFVMELPGDNQVTVDKFLDGEINTSELYPQINGLRQSDFDLLNFAKEKGMKIIAGDMTRRQMQKWIDDNPKLVENIKKTSGNPKQAAVVVAVLMEKERSLVTGKKIRQLLSANPNAEVWINCGALHVSNIIRGIYDIDESRLPTIEKKQPEKLPQTLEPKKETAKTSGNELSLTDTDPFAVVTRISETNPALIRLKETLNKLRNTPIPFNSELIREAINYVDDSKGILSDQERAAVYLGISYQYTDVLSPEKRLLVNRIIDTMDNLDLDKNQKLQRLSKILSGTNLYQTDLIQDILAKINQYVTDADNVESLIQLQSSLKWFSGDFSQQLQKKIQLRLASLK